MKENNLISQLEGMTMWSFYPELARVSGSVKGGLLLSVVTKKQQAVGWSEWWCFTAEDWEWATGMTRRELDGAREACKEFVETKRAGLPSKTFYRLNADALLSAITR